MGASFRASFRSRPRSVNGFPRKREAAGSGGATEMALGSEFRRVSKTMKNRWRARETDRKRVEE